MPTINTNLKRGSRRGTLGSFTSPSLTADIVPGYTLWLDAGNPDSYGGAGTTWYDLSTGNHDCTLVNGPVYSSSDGGYFDFDGVSDYGTISNHADFYFGTGAFTVEVWAMTQDLAKTYQILCGNHNGGIGGGWYYYGDNGSDVEAFGYASQANNVGAETLSQDTWYHFVVRRDANGVDFFRNNVAGAADEVFSDNITNNGLNLIIGQTYSYSAVGVDDIYCWDGRIAQVRIYKGTALTDAEISGNYTAHKARYGY